MAEISRRRLALLAGSVISAASAQAAPQSDSAPGNPMERQREGQAEALAELQKVSLDYGDEPMFTLVVR